MGVSMLYTFLKNIGALRKVYISEEADNYRKAKNQSPVIAVDGINLMYSIYRYYQISWPYGGQLKEYMEHLECFIDSFQREGIDLIFFFDGANVIFNVDGWIKRKIQTVNEIHVFFDKIEYGISLSSYDENERCITLPSNIWAVTVYVLKQKRCEKSYKKWTMTEKRFCDIAFFIRRLNLKIHNGKILNSDIIRISRNFYGDENMSKVLQESINFYNIKSKENGFSSITCGISDYKWKSVIKMFYKDFHGSGNSLDILIRHCFQDHISLQDFRCTDIPPFSKVLKQLRERWYGILLFEKPGSKKVTEWLIDGFEGLVKAEEVCPQFPKVHHPGLVALIRGYNIEHNWNLLGNIFNLDPCYMKKIPEYLLIPALTFRYLKDKVTIHKCEMNALILSVIIVRYFNARALKEIYLDELQSRPVRLYNLVTYSFETVLNFFQILGNLIYDEMALPTNYQDGKLFQLLYQLSFDDHMSLKQILNKIFDSYLENDSKDTETSLKMFQVMSTFIEK